MVRITSRENCAPAKEKLARAKILREKLTRRNVNLRAKLHRSGQESSEVRTIGGYLYTLEDAFQSIFQWKNDKVYGTNGSRREGGGEAVPLRRLRGALLASFGRSSLFYHFRWKARLAPPVGLPANQKSPCTPPGCTFPPWKYWNCLVSP